MARIAAGRVLHKKPPHRLPKTRHHLYFKYQSPPPPPPPLGRRRLGRLDLQLRITPNARRNPPAGQGCQCAQHPGLLPPRHAGRVCHHAAQVALCILIPAQRSASATTAARYQHPQRAGLCQATQAAAIARFALGWLGRCRRLQPHNGRRRLGHAKATPNRAGVKETMDMEGEAIRAASGDAAATPDHAPRKGAAKAANAKKRPQLLRK